MQLNVLIFLVSNIENTSYSSSDFETNPNLKQNNYEENDSIKNVNTDFKFNTMENNPTILNEIANGDTLTDLTTKENFISLFDNQLHI